MTAKSSIPRSFFLPLRGDMFAKMLIPRFRFVFLQLREEMLAKMLIPRFFFAIEGGKACQHVDHQVYFFRLKFDAPAFVFSQLRMEIQAKILITRPFVFDHWWGKC